MLLWSLRAAFLYIMQFVTYGVGLGLYYGCVHLFLVDEDIVGALMLSLFLTIIVVALCAAGFATAFRNGAIREWRAGTIRRGDTAVLDGDGVWNREFNTYVPGDWVTLTVKNPDGITRGNGTHFAFGAEGVIPRGATVSAIGLPHWDDVLCRYESSPAEQTKDAALPTGTWFILPRLAFVTSTKRYLATEQHRLRAVEESRRAVDKAARAEQAEKARMTRCATA